MSETPRTDAEASDGRPYTAITVPADFARRLERALTAANARVQRAEEALRESEFFYQATTNTLNAEREKLTAAEARAQRAEEALRAEREARQRYADRIDALATKLARQLGVPESTLDAIDAALKGEAKP